MLNLIALRLQRKKKAFIDRIGDETNEDKQNAYKTKKKALVQKEIRSIQNSVVD